MVIRSVHGSVRSLRVDIYSRRRGQRPGSSGVNRQGFLQGLVGGEQESVDRIFTGQISGFLNGNLAGTQNNNIQYGFESSCPEGLDQNTALLATAAAIGNHLDIYFIRSVPITILTFLSLSQEPESV